MQTLKSSKKIHQNASFPAKIFQRRGSAGPQSPVEGTASPLDLSPSGALIRYWGSVQNYGWVSRARRGHSQLTRLKCVFTWSIPSMPSSEQTHCAPITSALAEQQTQPLCGTMKSISLSHSSSLRARRTVRLEKHASFDELRSRGSVESGLIEQNYQEMP